MAKEWELTYGCQWNQSLGHWECHGLDTSLGILCPHTWGPNTYGRASKCEPNHDPNCPVGKMLAMKQRVNGMKVIVDRSVPENVIRVADPLVAEWLRGDGDAYRKRVYKEAGYCVGH